MWHNDSTKDKMEMIQVKSRNSSEYSNNHNKRKKIILGSENK